MSFSCPRDFVHLPLIALGMILVGGALVQVGQPQAQAIGLADMQCLKARHCTSSLCVYCIDANNTRVGYYCCTAGSGTFWACKYVGTPNPCPCVTSNDPTKVNTCTTCYYHGTDRCPTGLPASCTTGTLVNSADIIVCVR